MMLRERISPTHLVFGEGYRMLTDDDVIQPGDETACVSTLLSYAGDRWVAVDEGDLGQTVGTILGPDSLDIDAHERVFRRKR